MQGNALTLCYCPLPDDSTCPLHNPHRTRMHTSTYGLPSASRANTGL
jgi:hypothetical protein